MSSNDVNSKQADGNQVNGKVLIKPYQKMGETGLDVEICSDEATVCDYCRALDEYILEGKFIRKRSDASTCEGCDTCCGERMPLTSVDAAALMQATGTDAGEFFRKYAYVAVSGRAVDITLARDYEDKCLFLDKTLGKCRNYHGRPFVCRTYVCTHLSPRASRLRRAIVNGGEDELVRLWLNEQEGDNLVYHEGERPDVRPGDWPLNAWSGKRDYGEVLLKDILPPSLWAECRKEGEENV